MIQTSRLIARRKFPSALPKRCLTSTALSQGGRTPPYRRIQIITNHERLSTPALSPFNHSILSTPFTEHLFLQKHFSTTPLTYAISFRDLKSDDKPKSSPKKEKAAKEEPEIDPAEEAYQQATRESQARVKAERARERARREEEEKAEKEEAEGKEEGGEEAEGKQNKQKDGKKKEAPPPPPPHGNKSPWQVFTETLKTEFKASKEWNESTKQLASSAHQFTENESVKRARAAYSAASGAATSSTASALKGTGKALGQGAAWTWDSSVVKGVRATANAAGRGIDKATQPIRETSAFKSVKDVVDDGSSSKYGGWLEKEERRKRREQRELEASGTGRSGGRRVEKAEEDPNAGTNVTLHKDSRLNEKWREFRDSNRVMQSIFSLKSSYAESENPLISTARGITDRVAGFFAENETALVIKKFKEMDPSFSIEPFLREMREYILPEVLDAYVKADTETLKLWLSAPQYQVYTALAQQYKQAGLKSDGRILDIRNVDILSARKLEPGEIPVFIITCRTQEVHVYRNAKTNDLAAGMEDKVQQVTYAIGVTRVPEDVNNPDTRGWRLIELQKSARDYI